ncbi:hypothetical protein K8T06_03250 [bacterium]|nr:hypothetical protein [bacterium]
MDPTEKAGFDELYQENLQALKLQEYGQNEQIHTNLILLNSTIIRNFPLNQRIIGRE